MCDISKTLYLHFNKKPKEIKSDNINIQNIIWYSSLNNDNIKEILASYIYNLIFEKASPYIKIKTLKSNDLVVPHIKHLTSDYIDTLIGYKYWTSHKESAIFSNLLDKYTKFNCAEVPDFMLFLSKSNFYIKFLNLKVTLLDIDKKSLKKIFSQENDGYYNHIVTNDLNVSCSIDELKLLVNTRRCMLSISGTVEYGFSNPIIGFGIKLKK